MSFQDMLESLPTLRSLGGLLYSSRTRYDQGLSIRNKNQPSGSKGKQRKTRRLETLYPNFLSFDSISQRKETYVEQKLSSPMFLATKESVTSKSKQEE